MVQIGAGIATAIQKVANLPFFYPKGAVMVLVMMKHDVAVMATSAISQFSPFY